MSNFYNFFFKDFSFNLDPKCKHDWSANRVLLLEPSKFKDHPVSGKLIDFICILAKNIPGIKFYIGEFEELKNENNLQVNNIYFKEHPLNYNHMGNQEKRDGMFDLEGYYSLFFKFWKS